MTKARTTALWWSAGFLFFLTTVLGARAAEASPIELVTNGGFETGDLTGWTCTGADLCEAQSTYVHSGSYAMWGYDNTNYATLSQQIATAPGQTYTFSFYSLALLDNAANILRYQLGTGPIVTVPRTNAFALTSTPFLANSSLTPVNFYFETDPGTEVWVLDDVSVTGTAVPEPVSVLLLGTGLGAIAARRRLKKRT